MKVLRLYISNFICHENSFIDFSKFSSAIIVGKKENNDYFSNGVGKTTIFKAIEYVLFNQADVNLEEIIREDTEYCQVVIDFLVNDQEYRLSRSRTKKGSSDLSLYIKTTEQVKYHKIENNIYEPIFTDWKNISGSRTTDTEKDLAKLIKINFKSFRNTVHFVQNDFSGLTTATPEKRKALLKEVLSLTIYSKLEKIAKDKYNKLLKDVDKINILLSGLGDPEADLLILNNELNLVLSKLSSKKKNLESLDARSLEFSKQLENLNASSYALEAKIINVNLHKNTLQQDISKIEISLREISSKKNNTVNHQSQLHKDINNLSLKCQELNSIDYDNITLLETRIKDADEKIIQLNIENKNYISQFEKLKTPFPEGTVCKHCRQVLTFEHKQNCLKQIELELTSYQNNIQSNKKTIVELSDKKMKDTQKFVDLKKYKEQLNVYQSQIELKSKEIEERNQLLIEFNQILQSLTLDIANKQELLIKITDELNSYNSDEIKEISLEKDYVKKSLLEIKEQISFLQKEITHFENQRAVIQHSVNQKEKDLLKKKDLYLNLSKLEEQNTTYPLVLQAFSSTGIPNLIIQNVLDDLQYEANNLLAQLKPGLQLSFLVEKTKNDGTEADTLDIIYSINNKKRTYDQLSGAMKLAVTFSIKLGLSFLLQKLMGSDVKLLLLDEIDQSLDKAGADAFAEIVKFFQKDFTILIVTHSDRMKEKFNSIICVEQDVNFISRARII